MFSFIIHNNLRLTDYTKKFLFAARKNLYSHKTKKHKYKMEFYPELLGLIQNTHTRITKNGVLFFVIRCVKYCGIFYTAHFVIYSPVIFFLYANILLAYVCVFFSFYTCGLLTSQFFFKIVKKLKITTKTRIILPVVLIDVHFLFLSKFLNQIHIQLSILYESLVTKNKFHNVLFAFDPRYFFQNHFKFYKIKMIIGALFSACVLFKIHWYCFFLKKINTGNGQLLVSAYLIREINLITFIRNPLYTFKIFKFFQIVFLLLVTFYMLNFVCSMIFSNRKIAPRNLIMHVFIFLNILKQQYKSPSVKNLPNILHSKFAFLKKKEKNKTQTLEHEVQLNPT